MNEEGKSKGASKQMKKKCRMVKKDNSRIQNETRTHGPR